MTTFELTTHYSNSHSADVCDAQSQYTTSLCAVSAARCGDYSGNRSARTPCSAYDTYVCTTAYVNTALTVRRKAWKLPPMFTGCVAESFRAHFWAYWVPLSVFQGAIVVLAIIKIWETGKQDWYTPRLLKILLRDSLAYFGGAVAIIIVNMLIWSIGRVRTAPGLLSDEHASDKTCS